MDYHLRCGLLRRASLIGSVLASLEWLLLLVFGVPYVTSTGCRFPDFLQSSEQGMGNWTCKYGENTIRRIDVMGGQYLVFHSSNTTVNGPSPGGHHRHNPFWAGKVMVQQRRCVQKLGSDKFVVEHVEPRPTYQCVQFIKRSPWVVQLKLSQALSVRTNICKLDLTLDEYPWISLKGYQSASVPCPFSGGLNFHRVAYYTKDHNHINKKHKCRNSDQHVRIEGDCVEDDGIYFQMGSKHCLRKQLKSFHFLCMASWNDEKGDGFAMVRSANGDRLFYCLRIHFRNSEVYSLHLYLDWVCYRGNDLQTNHIKLSFTSAYITFHKAEKKLISTPCTDQRQDCSNSKQDCEDNQCMATCEKCVNTTLTQCEFSDNVIGRWHFKQANRDGRTLQITKKELHHPSFGQLECVSFNQQIEARLRAILWEHYENGCYPRFVCMHYDMPNKSVMRYRMGDVIEWPMTLTDESICHEDHFQVAPDMAIPTDTYHPKPWLVALRASRSIPTMPCVLPSYIPRHASVLTNDNRTGCITLRPDFGPSTVSVAFFQDSDDSRYSKSKLLQVETFQCVAALTYTSIVTLNPGNRKDFLCWVVVDDVTIVVIQTSACNEWTAMAILEGRDKYFPNLKFWLTLGAGGQEVVETCGKHYKEEQASWLTGYENTNMKRKKYGNAAGSLRSFYRDDMSCILVYYSLLCLSLVLLGYEELVLPAANVRLLR